MGCSRTGAATYEGWLKKTGRYLGFQHDRWCVLRGQELIRHKEKDGPVCKTIGLHKDVQIEPHPDGVTFSLLIDAWRYTFTAVDQSHRDKWVEHIAAACRGGADAKEAAAEGAEGEAAQSGRDDEHAERAGGGNIVHAPDAQEKVAETIKAIGDPFRSRMVHLMSFSAVVSFLIAALSVVGSGGAQPRWATSTAFTMFACLIVAVARVGSGGRPGKTGGAL